MSEWVGGWVRACVCVWCLPARASGGRYIFKELLTGGSIDVGRDTISVWKALTKQHHYNKCSLCVWRVRLVCLHAFRQVCVCGCVYFTHSSTCVCVCHTKGNYADCLNEGGINHNLHCNHLQRFMFAINLLITTVLGIRLWHLFYLEGGRYELHPDSSRDISYLNKHRCVVDVLWETTSQWLRGHFQF